MDFFKLTHHPFLKIHPIPDIGQKCLSINGSHHDLLDAAGQRHRGDGRTRKRRAGAAVVSWSRHGQDSESEASSDDSSEAPSDGSAGPSTKVGAISSSIEV